MVRGAVSTSTSARRSRRAVLATALLAALFTAGTFAAPAIEPLAPRGARWLRRLYAPLCHQKPERSLAIGRGVQAVCARCSGLYLGGVAGLLAGAIWMGLRLRPRWLAWAVAPTLVDVLSSWIGLGGLSELPRLWLAGPAGLVAGLFLASAVADLARQFHEREALAPGHDAERCGGW